jgi:hypothetical protein
MEMSVQFIGRAEPLAELYEGIGSASFVARDLAGTTCMLRMHDNPG